MKRFVFGKVIARVLFFTIASSLFLFGINMHLYAACDRTQCDLEINNPILNDGNNDEGWIDNDEAFYYTDGSNSNAKASWIFPECKKSGKYRILIEVPESNNHSSGSVSYHIYKNNQNLKDCNVTQVSFYGYVALGDSVNTHHLFELEEDDIIEIEFTTDKANVAVGKAMLSYIEDFSLPIDRYSQTDERWRCKKLCDAFSESDTDCTGDYIPYGPMGNFGCTTCAFTSALSYYGVCEVKINGETKPINPRRIAAIIDGNGGYNSGHYMVWPNAYDAMDDLKEGIGFEHYDPNESYRPELVDQVYNKHAVWYEIERNIKKGYPVVIKTKFSSGANHWVLIKGIHVLSDNDVTFYICDSYPPHHSDLKGFNDLILRYLVVTEPKLIDVALIIDSSGSMIWNDPQDLRKEAAKIFVDTAQNNDQIAIVDFDSWSHLRWPLQPLTENRDSIKSAVDLINSSGGTSLSAGLIEGYNQLNSSTQTYKKAAVFLTDGVGSYSNEAELYKNYCWPIYTIGLGYSTNPALLQSIADTTGGKYFALTDPDQLKNVYFEIATQILGGSSLLSESSVMSPGDTYIASVTVPSGQQSATFLTTWPGSDVNTSLTTPGGSEITPATNDPNIYYAKGLTYELYRITNPEAGIWAVSLYGADLAPEGETVNISVSSVGPSVPQDTTPPVITISNPIDDKIYFDQVPTSFSFAVEDPETAVTSQTALLNGSPINNNDNILLTQLGENILTIIATNEADLTSELSITFYVNHFSWLPPIRYQAGSSTETLTSVIQANSTLPLKFAIFDADSSFIEDTTVKVVVEGTTAQFTYGEGDTNIRINQEEEEEPLYIVNIHTNFNKCDYGLEEGNEYNLTIYFNEILAARTKLRIE